MKGAAAVLDRKISTPRRSMVITMGNSHHFLFCLRNAQNSLSKLSPWCSAAAFSNSLVGLGDVSLMVDELLGENEEGRVDNQASELSEIAPRVGGDCLGRPV